MTSATWLKGHLHGNDAIVLIDLDGATIVRPSRVQQLCNRERGVGASAVVRVTSSVKGWTTQQWRADGSPTKLTPELMGVVTAALRVQGLAEVAELVETSGGGRAAIDDANQVRANVGSGTLPGGMDALTSGFDVTVAVEGLAEPRPGLRLNLAGPHVVVALGDETELNALTFTSAARVEPRPGGDFTVVFAVPLGEHEDMGVLRLRSLRVRRVSAAEQTVDASDVGAAVLAMRTWFGTDAPTQWEVRTGADAWRVDVVRDEDDEGERVEVTAPVTIVARLELDPEPTIPEPSDPEPEDAQSGADTTVAADPEADAEAEAETEGEPEKDAQPEAAADAPVED